MVFSGFSTIWVFIDSPCTYQKIVNKVGSITGGIFERISKTEPASVRETDSVRDMAMRPSMPPGLEILGKSVEEGKGGDARGNGALKKNPEQAGAEFEEKNQSGGIEPNPSPHEHGSHGAEIK